jgi:tetraacyldisaccharide 4'-kinase
MLRAHQVDVPVISIGNLTLGGTGKTPMVEFVCRWFLQRGKRPIILSRGYRAAGGCNDEARLLQSNLPEVPHLQGKDRVALARHACEHFAPDVLVLDDGFQHRRLARDLDIVLIDCTEPFGYGRIFPRGLLREPIGSLRRAGLVVLSRADQCLRADRDRIRAQIFDAAGEKPIVEAVHRPTALRSGWLGLSPRSPGCGIEDSATATQPRQSAMIPPERNPTSGETSVSSS